MIDTAWRRIAYWLDEPVSASRVEIVRIAIPIVALGFMSERIAHVGEWIGDEGFRVPDLGDDWRQPLYVPPLPMWAAYTIAALMIMSGVFVMLGVRTRVSAIVFAATLAFVALSDLETTARWQAPEDDARVGCGAVSSAHARRDLQRVGHREGAR